MSSLFSKAMLTYNKSNYTKECLTDIVLAAENGFEPALHLLLSDIFVHCRCNEQDKLYTEKELYQMLKKLEGYGYGILYYILSNKENECGGAAQNLYRQSMEHGFILGKIQFARYMFQQSNFSLATRHYLEVFEHKHYKLLSNDIQSHVLNDLSLCYYKEKDYESFWKYNKKARTLNMGVAMNNAANAYMRGYGKDVNIKKALRLYKEALSCGYSADGYVEKQIETCNSLINN